MSQHSLANLLACPNCKNALEQQISAGFAWSIGLLMIVPILIFLFWALLIYRYSARRSISIPAGR